MDEEKIIDSGITIHKTVQTIFDKTNPDLILDEKELDRSIEIKFTQEELKSILEYLPDETAKTTVALAKLKIQLLLDIAPVSIRHIYKTSMD